MGKLHFRVGLVLFLASHDNGILQKLTEFSTYAKKNCIKWPLLIIIANNRIDRFKA